MISAGFYAWAFFVALVWTDSAIGLCGGKACGEKAAQEQAQQK